MKNRFIFITGASGGLGSALAFACAARGATVVLHGRKSEKLDQLYDAIVDARHPEPFLMPLDFTQASVDAFGQIADAIKKQCGSLDALVHCAAELGAVSPLEHQSVEHLRATWLTNTLSPIMLTRALSPALRAAAAQSRAPRIIFTTDSHVDTPAPYWGGYGVSKAAIAHFAQILAQEWDFAKVHAIAPGAIDSPLRTKTHPGETKESRIALADAISQYVALLDD